MMSGAVIVGAGVRAAASLRQATELQEPNP